MVLVNEQVIGAQTGIAQSENEQQTEVLKAIVIVPQRKNSRPWLPVSDSKERSMQARTCQREPVD
jgi:hypothetical protein